MKEVHFDRPFRNHIFPQFNHLRTYDNGSNHWCGGGYAARIKSALGNSRVNTPVAIERIEEIEFNRSNLITLTNTPSVNHSCPTPYLRYRDVSTATGAGHWEKSSNPKGMEIPAQSCVCINVVSRALRPRHSIHLCCNSFQSSVWRSCPASIAIS